MNTLENIIPANNVVAMAKSVASTLVLLLNNNNVRLIKLSTTNSILWDRFIGSYEGRGGASIFSIVEDAQSFIHVIASISGVFKPYICDLNLSGAISVKLNDSGEAISHTILSNITNFTTVFIHNDAWLISNSGNTIQIQNLTLGGKISSIRVSGNVQYFNSYYVLNKLCVVANVCGIISYKQKALNIRQPTAILLIIDTITWELWDYFRVTYTLADPLSPGEETRTNLYVSGIIVRDHYLMAGYTNTSSISVYHRDNLIRAFSLSFPSTLFLIRITMDMSILEDVLTPDVIDDIDVSINTFPFDTNITQKFNLLSLGKDNLLQGITRTNILHKALGLRSELHNDIHNTSMMFLLRVDSNLNILNYTFLGSGNNMIARACECNDNCNNSELRIPCRPIRIFNPPQVLGTVGCNDCNGNNCNGVPGLNGDNVYTCQSTQQHCYSTFNVQPGNLYMTKYNTSLTQTQKRALLNPTDSLVGLAPTSGDPYMNTTIITNEDGSSLVGYRFIDHIIMNNSAVQQVYAQKWYGFLLSFS